MRPVAVTVRVKSLEMGSRSQNSEIELVMEFISLESFFLTNATYSLALAGPNCIILKLCHSPMVSMLL